MDFLKPTIAKWFPLLQDESTVSWGGCNEPGHIDTPMELADPNPIERVPKMNAKAAHLKDRMKNIHDEAHKE